MEILSYSRVVTVPHFEIFFQYAGATSFHGFIFPALESGEVDLEALNKKPNSLINYFKCLSGEIEGHKVNAPEFKKWEHHYTEPTIGKCDCGCEVMLDRFTNTCDCGLDYNMSGQLLAHRSQWGEETGESYCDLMGL